MDPLQTTELKTFQLKAARRALGFSLKEVAKDTGIAESALIRLESCSLDDFPKRSSIPTVFRLRQFLEQNGITFLKDNMVQYHPHVVESIQVRIVLPENKKK